MAQMTDPHNGLVSFQAALLGGHIQPRVCSKGTPQNSEKNVR